jgi:hypothetical protein
MSAPATAFASAIGIMAMRAFGFLITRKQIAHIRNPPA